MTDLSETPLKDLTVDSPDRPRMPPLPDATDAHRRQGRQLAAIHRGHLWQLARIGKVMERIQAGDSPPEDLAEIVLSLDMSQNFRAFGTLCGQECQMLTFHHDIEQQSMFPRLEATGNTALQAVVARLRAEHEVVHELLNRLERAAMALMHDANEENFANAAAIFQQLKTVITSHFGYEEKEIEEAIGLYLDHI